MSHTKLGLTSILAWETQGKQRHISVARPLVFVRLPVSVVLQKKTPKGKQQKTTELPFGQGLFKSQKKVHPVVASTNPTTKIGSNMGGAPSPAILPLVLTTTAILPWVPQRQTHFYPSARKLLLWGWWTLRPSAAAAAAQNLHKQPQLQKVI